MVLVTFSFSFFFQPTGGFLVFEAENTRAEANRRPRLPRLLSELTDRRQIRLPCLTALFRGLWKLPSSPVFLKKLNVWLVGHSAHQRNPTCCCLKMQKRWWEVLACGESVETRPLRQQQDSNTNKKITAERELMLWAVISHRTLRQWMQHVLTNSNTINKHLIRLWSHNDGYKPLINGS